MQLTSEIEQQTNSTFIDYNYYILDVQKHTKQEQYKNTFKKQIIRQLFRPQDKCPRENNINKQFSQILLQTKQMSPKNSSERDKSNRKACNFRLNKSNRLDSNKTECNSPLWDNLDQVLNRKYMLSITTNYSNSNRNYQHSYRNRGFSQQEKVIEVNGQFRMKTQDSILNLVQKNHSQQKLVQTIKKNLIEDEPKLIRTLHQQQKAFKRIRQDPIRKNEYSFLFDDPIIRVLTEKLTRVFNSYIESMGSVQRTIQGMDNELRFYRYLRSIFIDQSQHLVTLSVDFNLKKTCQRIFSQEIYQCYLHSYYTRCQVQNSFLVRLQEKEEYMEEKYHFLSQNDEFSPDHNSSKHFRPILQTNQKSVVDKKGYFVNSDQDCGIVHSKTELLLKKKVKKLTVPSFMSFIYTIQVPDLDKLISQLEKQVNYSRNLNYFNKTQDYSLKIE